MKHWNHFRRFTISLILVSSVLQLSGCAVTSYLSYRASPDYPGDRSEILDLPGLEGPVDVYIDQGGVPHIRAEHETDLLRTVGFFHGRDRFFQMDVMRRIARGRLSELVGEQPLLSSTTVMFDLSMRGWGIDRAVAADAAGLDPQTGELMEAYTAGVNSAVEMYEPLEYRLLRIAPEPWTIQDSFALGRLNAWSLSHNWEQETSRLLFALHGGIDRAERIYGGEPWPGGVTLELDGPRHSLPVSVPPPLRELFPERPAKVVDPEEKNTGVINGGCLPSFSSASNGWVVAGNRSVSGKPMLANDPHMAHFLPSFLYQQHLCAPGIDVIGATIPGLPYVVMGHNRNVAWGTTSSVADVIDLYIEKVHMTDPGRYETPEGISSFEEERSIIGVMENGELKERTFTIRRSVHGPIMNDMYPDLFPSWAPPVAISWNTGTLSSTMASLGQANRARSVEELRLALQDLSTPSITWVAADRDDRIAVFATGMIPVRRNHRGTFPVPGWLREYQPAGTLDPLSLPCTVSDTGYFVHANNLLVHPEYDPDVLLQVDSAPPYRFDRISELLEQRREHSPAAMAAIQQDVFLPRARNILPAILEDLGTAGDWNSAERTALELLRGWDFEGSEDSAAATVFFVTYREAVLDAVRDEVDTDGMNFILTRRYVTNITDPWFYTPDHVIWDHRGTWETEDRRTVVHSAFRRAVAQIVAMIGSDDPRTWRWGKIHYLHIEHLFGSRKALAGYVNIPRIPRGGGLDSVWKSHFDIGNDEAPFRVIAGPAYRMIVDLADMEHGEWVIDTGASGWPGSPHYRDQHAYWARGEYLPMISAWEEIEATARARITLK